MYTLVLVSVTVADCCRSSLSPCAGRAHRLQAPNAQALGATVQALYGCCLSQVVGDRCGLPLPAGIHLEALRERAVSGLVCCQPACDGNVVAEGILGSLSSATATSAVES